jgi:cell division protein FtsZ
VACPLLEGIDLSGARGVLVLIAASRASFKLNESRIAMNTIRMYAAEDAHVIFGAAYDEALGDQLRVTVIATGLTGAARAKPATPIDLKVIGRTAAPLTGQRTGTDNVPILGTALPAAGASTPTMGRASPAHDAYSGLGTPSVWRNARSKVEALASNGMDEIDIPAFLRKQAD